MSCHSRVGWLRLAAAHLALVLPFGVSGAELEGDPFDRVDGSLGFREQRVDEATVAGLMQPARRAAQAGLVSRVDVAGTSARLVLVDNQVRVLEGGGRVLQILDIPPRAVGVIEGLRPMGDGRVFIPGSGQGYVAELDRTAGRPVFRVRPLVTDLYQARCSAVSGCRPARGTYVASLDRVLVGGLPGKGPARPVSYEFHQGQLTPLLAHLDASRLPEGAELDKGVLLRGSAGGLHFYDGERSVEVLKPDDTRPWRLARDPTGRRLLLIERDAYQRPRFEGTVEGLTTVLLKRDGHVDQGDLGVFHVSPLDGTVMVSGPRGLAWQVDGTVRWGARLANGFQAAGGGFLRDGDGYLRVRRVGDGAQAIYRIHRPDRVVPRPPEMTIDPFRRVQDPGLSVQRIDPAVFESLRAPFVDRPKNGGLVTRAEVPGTSWTVSLVGSDLEVTNADGAVVARLWPDQPGGGSLEGFRIMRDGWLFVRGSKMGYIANIRASAATGTIELRPLTTNLYLTPCSWFGWLTGCRAARGIYVPSLDRVLVGGHPLSILGFGETRSYELVDGQLRPLDWRVEVESLPEDAELDRHLILPGRRGGRYLYDGVKYTPVIKEGTGGRGISVMDAARRRTFVYLHLDHGPPVLTEVVDGRTVTEFAVPGDAVGWDIRRVVEDPNDRRVAIASNRGVLWQQGSRFEWALRPVPGVQITGAGLLKDGDLWVQVGRWRDATESVFRIHRERR